ncbi:hypothetical protein BT69DRAFT_1290027 [Atractiella rhizophila]|nr:hypothetical protein BT69DRAFT_1290027 [Atractiella rhizophila]
MYSPLFVLLMTAERLSHLPVRACCVPDCIPLILSDEVVTISRNRSYRFVASPTSQILKIGILRGERFSWILHLGGNAALLIRHRSGLPIPARERD